MVGQTLACIAWCNTGEIMDSIKEGAAGQTRTLERAGSRPTNQVSTSEQKTVLPAGGAPPRPSPYGTCPSCGFPKEHVADRYCDLCRKAREDEEERACPSTLPALVLRTLGDRPGNEDQLRGISSDPMGAVADALRDQAEARAEDEVLKQQEHMCNCVPDEECCGGDGDE